MSGWIKVEKDLSTDPRVLRMASRLRHADVTLGSRSRLVIVGALVTLWWYADTHICDDDTLPIGVDQINELVGIEGFCDLMPADWLQVLDSDRVKLVDYTTHNGTTAKKRALAQKRQERCRNGNVSVTPASRSHNANSVTREEKSREDKERENARAIPQGRAGVAEVYDALQEDWRRDVPEANPAAFQKWIVHVESQGKPLGSQQRLLQARRLAGNGDFPIQAEVVDYCIEQGWKTLVPLRDVRKRTQGMSRPDKPGDKPKEQREAEDAQRMRALRDSRASRGIPNFREPYPVESPDAYETALKLEMTHGPPRDMSAIQQLAASKRVGG